MAEKMEEAKEYLTAAQLSVEMRVVHSRFGEGRVVGIGGPQGQELVGVHSKMNRRQEF